MDNSAFPGIVVVKVVKMAMPGTRSPPPYEGERVFMHEAKDEIDLPFEILEPVEWRGPAVFNSPHSGSVYPHAFLTTTRLDIATLRRSEDFLSTS